MKARSKLFISSCDLGTYRICEHAKRQASLYIRTVSPETSLIALKGRDIDEGSVQIVYTSSCDLGTYPIFEQQKTRRACTFAQSRQSLC